MEDFAVIEQKLRETYPDVNITASKNKALYDAFYFSGTVAVQKGNKYVCTFQTEPFRSCCGMRQMYGFYVHDASAFGMVADMFDMMSYVPMLYIQAGNPPHENTLKFLEYYGATSLMKYRNAVHNSILNLWVIIPRPGRDYVADVTTEMERI